MNIFQQAISAWSDITGVENTVPVMQTERVKGTRPKAVQTRIMTGVYRNVTGKMLRYIAIGHSGNGNRIYLYFGKSEEEAISARKKWEETHEATTRKRPKIILTERL